MRISVVVGAACAALVAAGVAAETAATAAPHKPPSGTRMLLTFDHGESLKPRTLVRDESGFRHPGMILSVHGGALRAVHGPSGRGVAFPRACHGCGRAVIEVENARGLNPRMRSFLFGASVRVGPKRAAVGSNFIQKGFYSETGGQYKLQLRPGGVPTCRMYGAAGRLIVNGDASIADGTWHKVTCLRLPGRVQLRVDGKLVAGVKGSTGAIDNDQPLRIGGKKLTAPNKQFHGALDSAFVRLLPR
jgi:hypothetical protein